MSDENGSSKQGATIKVVDRRWFTDDGTLREDRVVRVPQEKSAPARQSPQVESQPHQPAAQPSAPVASSPAFLELVGMIAQQAELMLVGGPGMPKQPDNGLRLIEYLAVLEAKTRGNLSTEESQVLSNILFQLRSLGSRTVR